MQFLWHESHGTLPQVTEMRGAPVDGGGKGTATGVAGRKSPEAYVTSGAARYWFSRAWQLPLAQVRNWLSQPASMLRTVAQDGLACLLLSW